jgi:hypothetical protein
MPITTYHEIEGYPFFSSITTQAHPIHSVKIITNKDINDLINKIQKEIKGLKQRSIDDYIVDCHQSSTLISNYVFEFKGHISYIYLIANIISIGYTEYRYFNLNESIIRSIINYGKESQSLTQLEDLEFRGISIDDSSEFKAYKVTKPDRFKSIVIDKLESIIDNLKQLREGIIDNITNDTTSFIYSNCCIQQYKNYPVDKCFIVINNESYIGFDVLDGVTLSLKPLDKESVSINLIDNL